MDDLPDVVDKYDYLREKLTPGDKVKAIQQCQKAFGDRFVPHVKPKEKPFEVYSYSLICLAVNIA